MADRMVLLPGMNCSARLWDGCGLDAQVLPLDQPSIAGQVEALAELLPPRAAICGLSLGGIVAMAYTRRFPERVSRLCLMSTNAAAPTPSQRRGWRSLRSQLAAGRSAREAQRDLLPVLVSERACALDPGLPDRVLAMGEDTGSAVLDAQLRMQETRGDELAHLVHVAVPTLVVAGRDDALCPVTFHEAIAARVPGAELVVVPAGHLIPMERPEATGALLSRWARGELPRGPRSRPSTRA